MSRETVNLICAELPGADKVAGPEGDLWALAREPFARVGAVVEVREAAGWAVLPPLDDHAARERIVEAYRLVRASLPAGVRITLDRTSG
ncbi:hypothetical protein [Rubellimicrobium aerolatum]|uniref:MmcQ/YjbR family DNA-binding protein n=1 Tax=Rubellimicrobium aerolatum TaxID=490979 RepID=A0ABW0S7S8_9RHOB|nr:hypothetical protein [Rubellimicrobium aerolatum]MBP1804482.1 hypothetical protein [Rubellimicrobium aerolatum]